MKRARPTSFISRWLATLLAALILFAPLAGESVAEHAAEAACLQDGGEIDASGAGGEPGDAPEHARHHAHGCGACHLHVLAVDERMELSLPQKTGRFDHQDMAAASHPPSGHFRPPRD